MSYPGAVAQARDKTQKPRPKRSQVYRAAVGVSASGSGEEVI